MEYHPRRNRLTHNLLFEEFEMVLENWVKLEREYEARTYGSRQLERWHSRIDLDTNKYIYLILPIIKIIINILFTHKPTLFTY